MNNVLKPHVNQALTGINAQKGVIPAILTDVHSSPTFLPTPPILPPKSHIPERFILFPEV